MAISITQRRFLIIWVLFHTIGLAVNKANMKVHLRNERSSPIVNLFTTYHDEDSFWPFVTFMKYGALTDVPKMQPDENGIYDAYDLYWADRNSKESWNFFGIYNEYNMTAYIIYMLIGFAIIFLPKLWNPSSTNDRVALTRFKKGDMVIVGDVEYPVFEVQSSVLEKTSDTPTEYREKVTVYNMDAKPPIRVYLAQELTQV